MRLKIVNSIVSKQFSSSKTFVMAPERCATAKDLLKKFYHLQEERVQTYALFEETSVVKNSHYAFSCDLDLVLSLFFYLDLCHTRGFQGYLKGKPNYNFPLFRQLVHEITETFQKISQDVIVLKKELAEIHQQNLLADCIDNIQQQEKDKLEVVAQLQLLRQKVQDFPNDEHHEEVKEKKVRLQQINNNICSHMEDFKYEAEDLYH
ncbi:required for excision 1-B domain-containing protein isoform X1 [Octopus sinensis]|uniref:Required for excision 1-B domain-containing protein isoform X1 n=1 Tax=Octopus sinensis TaxID=2607531 RepID=A0A7E6FL69_9MOLL|nr:required for excision 1-B domain-containing protein isoform X1 [Octopus sinensis]